MPVDSFIRFETARQRLDFLPLLEGIYKYESSKISGSHIGLRTFDDYAWKKEDLVKWLWQQSVITSDSDVTTLGRLIEYMVEQNHMIRFTKIGTGEIIHASRMGEIVRTSGNLREYISREASGQDHDKRYPIIEGTRWEPRLKSTLPRKLSPEEIIQAVQNMFPTDYKLPEYLGNISIGLAIEDFSLVINAVNDEFKKQLKLSEFQLEGIQTALGQSWTNSKIRASVVTAGTGLGKTLCFAIPVITDALIRTRLEEELSPKGTSQLLLYPRNDLAKDQFKVIKGLLIRINKKLVANQEQDRCFGVAIDADGLLSTPKENYPYKPQDEGPTWGIGNSNVYEAATQVYKQNPASIVIASIESFRRRLRNPEVCSGLNRSLCRIVMDEVHLSSGTQGAHHKLILSRVKQLIWQGKKRLTFIGASATIAAPREHVGTIWGVSRTNVEHVDATSSSQDEVPLGIVNHLLLRPRAGTSPIGAVVDATSSIGHQRRSQNFANRPNIDKLQKTVCFSDSHEVVGNWQSNFIVNESTEMRRENLINSIRPYAHWFDRPLRIHESEEITGKEICNKCVKGEYSSTPLVLTTEELERFMHKLNNTNPDDSGRLYLPLEPEEEHEIRGLDTCPHLQYGTCWKFSVRSDESISRPSDTTFSTFRDSLRSKRHTSKTKSGGEDDEGDDFGANNSFKEFPRNGAYPRPKNSATDDNDTMIAHDLAIATPTLEVGVDMDEVSEVITHKAIRNISSYRQKIGRAGREPGTDSMAVTIMSLGSNDFHHYRAISRLIDRPIRDPVPIAKNNTNIIANEAYEAVFDYLAREGYDYDLIPRLKPTDTDAISKLDKLFADMIHDLKSNPRVVEYVKWAIEGNHTSKFDSIVESAISKIIEHLEILIQPMSGLEKPMSVIAWVACRRGMNAPPVHDPNQEIWRKLKGLDKDYWNGKYEDITEAIKNKNVDKIRTINDDIEAKSREKPPGWDLVAGEIEKMKDATADRIEAAEIREVTRRTKQDRSNFTYVSCLLRVLQSVTKDAPYASLPALFVNPNEAPVVVKQTFPGGGFRTESVTSGEALRFLLPGMWTHRLFKGGKRMFVMHSGDANTNGPYFMTPVDPDYDTSPLLGEAVEIGNHHSRFSKLLPIRVSKEVKMRKIKQLEVRSDNGHRGNGTQVLLATGNFEGLLSGNHSSVGDIEAENSMPKKRPNAWSVNWNLSDLETEGSETTSFKSDEIASRNDDTVLHVDSIRHPRLSGIFSSIKFHEKLKVTRVSLGVSRSNGPILVPSWNAKQICYNDEFQTEGIRFTLEPEVINYLFQAVDVNSIPYDDKFLDMLGSYMITNVFPNVNSFTLRSYLDLISNAAYRWESDSSEENQFPDYAKDFLELVFQSDDYVISAEEFAECASSNTLVDDDRLQDIVVELGTMHNTMIVECENLIQKLAEEYSKWTQQVFLNTLGVLITEAGASMAGVGFDSVGYTFELNEEENTGYIDFYDDDALGNGSTELCAKYMYLPQEIRDIAAHMGVENLPTSSFVDLFEAKLGMCQEHILQRIALSDINPKGLESWMVNEIKDLRNNNSKLWLEHEITNTRVASLMNRRRFAIAEGEEALEKELELAFNLCSTGCVACQGDFFSNLFPPHLVSFSTNRAIVDDITEKFRSKGYLKEIENQNEIIQNVGKDPGSNISFGAVDIDGKRAIIRPVRFGPGVRTTPVWIRDMQPPEQLDWWVRVQEVM